MAPHPDDETIAAGGLIARVAAAGGPVDVVIVTDGDGYPEAATALTGHEVPSATDYLALGRRRRDEARRAAGILAPRATVRFLGYPDDGLDPLARHPDAPFTSPHTGRGGFTGIRLVHELAAIVARTRPTLVVAPDPRDVHLDHAAAGRLVAAALAATAVPPRLLTYVVHDPSWPPALDPRADMPLPDTHRYPRTRWWRFPLTPAEHAAKRQALDTYTTQLPVLGGLLVRFLRASELYAEAGSACDR